MDDANIRRHDAAAGLPPIEVLITTFYVFVGYLIANITLGVLSLPFDEIYHTAAYIFWMAVLLRTWSAQTRPKNLIANLVLLLLGSVLAFDLFTTWIS